MVAEYHRRLACTTTSRHHLPIGGNDRGIPTTSPPHMCLVPCAIGEYYGVECSSILGRRVWSCPRPLVKQLGFIRVDECELSQNRGGRRDERIYIGTRGVTWHARFGNGHVEFMDGIHGVGRIGTASQLWDRINFASIIVQSMSAVIMAG